VKDRHVDPFTDFGFKRLFGSVPISAIVTYTGLTPEQIGSL
jgi:hypothetical protein